MPEQEKPKRQYLEAAAFGAGGGALLGGLREGIRRLSGAPKGGGVTRMVTAVAAGMAGSTLAELLMPEEWLVSNTKKAFLDGFSAELTKISAKQTALRKAAPYLIGGAAALGAGIAGGVVGHRAGKRKGALGERHKQMMFGMSAEAAAKKMKKHTVIRSLRTGEAWVGYPKGGYAYTPNFPKKKWDAIGNMTSAQHRKVFSAVQKVDPKARLAEKHKKK